MILKGPRHILVLDLEEKRSELAWSLDKSLVQTHNKIEYERIYDVCMDVHERHTDARVAGRGYRCEVACK